MFPFIEYLSGAAKFRKDYRCYSAMMLITSNRTDVDSGGKIVMPPSALELLTRMNVQFPMLFKIVNTAKNRTSHCGVLEFVAEEGRIYLPSWMMRNMQLEEGDVAAVHNIALPVATFSKFQPVSSEFLDITDPRAVLERGLRNFACLTVGDVVAFSYNDKVQELVVLETRPAEAVSIIECDMQVEFAPPIDYKEPEWKPKAASREDEPIMIDASLIPGASTFKAFEGSGQRVGGTKRRSSSVTPGAAAEIAASSNLVDVATLSKRGIPNYNWKPGKLTFRRNMRKGESTNENADETAEKKIPFRGRGLSLKDGLERKP